MEIACDRCGLSYPQDTAARLARCPWCGFDPSGDSGRFGHYYLLSVLGRGGLSVVFKARREDADTVALKILTTTRKSFVEQFEREGSVSARLSHPNIVRILDTGIVDSHRYIAFEFIEGPSFATAISRRAFDPAECARIIGTIARALLHAHRKGIIHRDITPRNILLTSAGVPKLTDFGLAVPIDSKTRLPAGVTAGTPVYMSPEQAAAMHDIVDVRSDIYSLGAVLYESVAGRPPFIGVNVLEILRKVQHEDPPPLREVDEDLAAIVARAMHKDPSRRYSTMKDFADDLQKYSAKKGAP